MKRTEIHGSSAVSRHRLALVLQGTAFSLLALTAPAAAQSFSTCEDCRASVQTLAEPWAENTAACAEGAVRIAIIDTGEPAARAFHLLVLHPSGDPQTLWRVCRLISDSDGSGFAGLSLMGLEAATDPDTGVTVLLPAVLFADGDVFSEATLAVTVDPATGKVQAAVK